MAALTKKAFLDRAPVREVKLGDGQAVYLRPLSASYFINAEDGQNEHFESWALIANSLCDENGKLFFTRDDKDHVLGMPLADFSILAKGIAELNGLAGQLGEPADGAEAGQAEKN